MSLFSKFYIKSFHIYKFTQVRCSLCTENKIILTTAFQVSEIMRCTKELHFLNYCSHKMNKKKHINLVCDIHDHYIPITDTTLELSVFWPSDTESRINEQRFSESISLSFKMRLTSATCFCGDVT